MAAILANGGIQLLTREAGNKGRTSYFSHIPGKI
jgi:hypothetical protein